MFFHEDYDIPFNGEVFVFGSNLAGRHGKGAALVARNKFGAEYGNGKGFMNNSKGKSYAIPTKNKNLHTLSLEEIKASVEEFREFVDNSSEKFFITRIGCGLAGYCDDDIAPMFMGFPLDRCCFPEEWKAYL